MTEQKPRTHLVIPDTQAKPGTPNDALGWVGDYIVEKQPDVIVHLGDHADSPSLSSYDVGKKDFEGRRYRDDVDAANLAFDVLCEPMETHNRRKAKQNKKQYKPELIMLHGNHESKQLPIILLGGAGGNLRGGRVLDYLDKPNRRMCSLFLNLMDWGGLKLDRFNDSTERLPAI